METQTCILCGSENNVLKAQALLKSINTADTEFAPVERRLCATCFHNAFDGENTVMGQDWEKYLGFAEQQLRRSRRANNGGIMIGSEKQIEWAEEIKATMMAQIDRAVADEKAMDNDERNLWGLSMIVEWLNGQTEAKWFIDNKGRNFTINWPAHIEKEIYG